MKNMTNPHPSGDAHWTRRTPERIRRGAASHAAKLSTDEIDALCAAYLNAADTQTGLARTYAVSRITVWRHLRARGLV